MLTNSYILYLKLHETFDSKHVLTHYQFIENITMSWIDPEHYGPQTKKKKEPDTDDMQ